MPNHGIIQNAIKTPADQYKAPVVKPVTTQVNTGTETVESRLNDITAKGSRYTNLAAQDARREANSRGLINSSISAAAGTEAAIRAALPIAQQDSKTFTDTRLNNQNVQNKFLENRQGANLNQEVAAQGSQLKQGEMNLGNTIQQEQNAQNAALNIDVATAQSGLTNQENTLLNDLTMKRDSGLSALTQAEQAQLNQLQIKRDSAQSGNVINQQNNQSGLSQVENQQLNDLQLKRDSAQATLTQAENAQLNQLTMKRDSALAQQTATQAQADNQLAINRDNNSAALNQNLATLESSLKSAQMKLEAGLRMTVEQALQGQVMSDNAKMGVLSSINGIISSAQDQIVQVGLSDRTGAQQAAAIIDIKTNRDAALGVYQEMLKSFPSWKWGTNFTPAQTGGNATGSTGGTGILTSYPTYPTDQATAQQLEADVSRGAYKNVNTPPSGTMQYSSSPAEAWKSSDGRWRWDSTIPGWKAGTWNNF